MDAGLLRERRDGTARFVLTERHVRRRHCRQVELGDLERAEARTPRAKVARGAHRHDCRRELVRDRPQQLVLLCAHAIDLVDVQQRRDAQALQRAHEDARLRLHALDSGDHEDCAVEHVQGTLDLGDEVRVAGRIDEVDRDVVNDERHHGGLDRDPPLPLKREEVGMGAARINAADLGDDAGGMEQALRQAGLTGVDMGDDPKVQR